MFFLATNLFLRVSHSRYCFLSYLFLRCHFLGMCLIDDKRVHDARIYFLRALRTIPRDHPSDSIFVDFMLSYEEVNDMKQARRISQWAIDSGSTIWCDKYQRPGFITSYANGRGMFIRKTDYVYNVLHHAVSYFFNGYVSIRQINLLQPIYVKQTRDTLYGQKN